MNISTILPVGVADALAGPAQPAAPVEGAQTAGFAALLAAVLRPAPVPAQTAPTLEGATLDAAPEAEDAPEGAEAESGGATGGHEGLLDGSHALRLTGVARPAAEPSVEEAAPDAAPRGDTVTLSTAAPAAKSTGESEGTGPVRGRRRVRGGDDPREVQRDVASLDPEFRARMERVVERMRSEFGHEVRVTETVRDQDRQEYLYQQGRTRPGPVVTWTRSSNHTAGRAADVVIDGSYHNPAGYARLARVAREEGLRTLGARDPGHLELPRGAATPGFRPEDGASDAPAAGAPKRWIDGLPGEPHLPARAVPLVPPAPQVSAGIAREAQVAGVAQVAPVAGVARVAQPAAVARVAAPGAPMSTGSRAAPVEVELEDAAVEALAVSAEAAPAKPAAAAAQPHPVRPAAAGTSADARHPGGEPGARERETAPAAAEIPARAEADPAALRPHAGAREPSSGPAAPAAPVAAAPGADAASQVARVMEAREAAPAGPLSSMTLRVENGQGGEDRIRVDVRGGSVDAVIDLGAPGEAARVTRSVGELQQALERQGLAAESLRVRGAPAEVVAQPLPARADAGSDPQRERPGDTPREQPRRNHEDPRQRSRREQGGPNP
ncbi:MAG TPA: hypothetical protein VF263_01690 [Longimicrobiaceae bacterium]